MAGTQSTHNEQLCRLSPLDNFVDNVNMVCGYVIQGDLDLGKVEAAIASVVDKWRMLAGRTVWLESEKIWAIRVPTGLLPANYRSYSFTSTTSTTPSNYSCPPLTSTTATYFPQPPRKHFVAPATACGNKAHQKAPLLSVHVSVFSDLTFLGITYPHGVLDGMGFGHVVRAIDAELNGREWDVPVLEEENKFVKVVRGMEWEEGEEKVEYTTFVPFGVVPLAKILCSLAVQRAWHGVESGQVYLGDTVVKKIVEPVKEEVRGMKGGKEWVSTGDVLNAWCVKTAYLDEADSPNTLEAYMLFDTRQLLSEASGTSFDTYPNNAALYAEIPHLPLRTLSTTPLPTLALHFRNALVASRTLTHLKSQVAHFRPQIAHREWGVDSWGFSNQVKARTGDVSWGEGVRVVNMVPYPLPMNSDSCILVNRLGSGYMLTGDLRKSRWASIVGELGRIKKELEV